MQHRKLLNDKHIRVNIGKLISEVIESVLFVQLRHVA